MFGNKNSEELIPSVNSNGSSNNNKSMPISNRINQGTSITGELESDGDLRVEGIIRGTLRTKSKVALGPTGLVEGDVYCKSADIEGKIVGDIEVSELLTLKSTCLVEGNIYTSKIVIENGARFNGVCTMGSKDKNQNAERITEAYEPEAV